MGLVGVLLGLSFLGVNAGSGVASGWCEFYSVKNRTTSTPPYAANSEPKWGVAEGILSTNFVFVSGMLSVVRRERADWTKGRLTKNEIYLAAIK